MEDSMGLFRRAKGVCPVCGKKKQADIGDKHPKAKKWNLTCSACGAKFTADIEPAWWIFFRDNNGKLKRRRIGQSRRAAERVLSKVKVELAEGRYIDRKATCKVTIRQLMEMYLSDMEPQRKKANYNRLRSVAKHFLRAFSPSTRIDKIGKLEIETYRRKRASDGAAIATINRELSDLSAALSWAVRRGMLDKKPVFSMPNPHNERERFLTRDEARRLIAACDPRIALIVQTAMFTGMRRGEILNMEWSWVDLTNRMINIPAHATKTGRGRHVPISNDMYRVLEKSMEHRATDCPYKSIGVLLLPMPA
jgi:integrase